MMLEPSRGQVKGETRRRVGAQEPDGGVYSGVGRELTRQQAIDLPIDTDRPDLVPQHLEHA
jgi:hypothetical protein